MEQLSEEELLHFLCAEGGKAKNSELLARYQPLINHVDPQLRALHRQTFKEIINKVAVVKQEHGEKYVILKKRFQPPAADTASTAIPAATVPSSMCSRVQQPGSGLVQWEGESRAAKSPDQAPSPPAERASPKEKHHGAVPRIQVKDFSAVLQSQLSSQWTGLHSVGWAHPVERPSSRPDSPEGRGAKSQSAASQEDEDAENSPKDMEQEVFEDGGSSVGSASVALDPVEKEWLQGAASGNCPALSQLLKQEPALAWKKDFTSVSTLFGVLHEKSRVASKFPETLCLNSCAIA
ncbi:ankyrin repeat domain-containing protein SOWAHA-like isoform X2 [Pleurodeles waltl]|uniref:ankyrin repeat domain-containing protein SOWAHA-like isoform X2 n=1 Tax=Pleurodeles waltl TaxID=8319 RepID=UPI0037096104